MSLLGAKGFLWYNPLLFLLIPAIIQVAKSKNKFKSESRMIIITSLILVIYYCLSTPNFSGWSYSIRWFVPILPYMYFFLYSVHVSSKSDMHQQLIHALMIISILISSVGLINPWSNAEFHTISFIANLKQLSQYLF